MSAVQATVYVILLEQLELTKTIFNSLFFLCQILFSKLRL